MSIILDALRRGRGRQTPRPTASTNAARTDAVLATLGYGRFSPASPFNRLKRLLTYALVGVAFALLLWFAVIWTTQSYLTPMQPSAARVPEPVSRPAQRPAPSQTPPSPAATERPTLPEPPLAAVPRRAAPSNPVTREPAPPSTSPTAAAASTETLPVVQSRRPDVPNRAPTAPTAAPSSTVLTSTARTNVVSQPDDHFALAVYNQRIGNFEEALVHYKAVLQRDELNAEAHNNLGLLYRDKGLLADAAKELQRAIAINPRYAKAHNNLGVVFLSQKKLDSATAEFREVLSLDPRNIEAMVNLAVGEKEAGRRDQARIMLTRALELDPRNPDAHYNLALIEDEAGNTPQAIKHYKSFLQYGAVAHADLMTDVRKRLDTLSR